jgi:hypothetical protein
MVNSVNTCYVFIVISLAALSNMGMGKLAAKYNLVPISKVEVVQHSKTTMIICCEEVEKMEIIVDENTALINHVKKIQDMQAEKNNEQTNKRKQIISLSLHPNH